MSDLNNEAGRRAIRDRLERGEKPGTLVFENHLGWADEAVVRDEARKLAARRAPLPFSGENTSSGSSSPGGDALVGIIILLGVAIIAVKAALSWVADNAMTLIALAGFVALVAAIIMGAKYFQVDGTGKPGSSPFSRWWGRKRVLAEMADSYQGLVSNVLDNTAGTVEHVLDCCHHLQMRDVYTEFLSHNESRSPVNRQKILEDSRGRLLEKKSFKDRPDLIFLFCMAHAMAYTYRPNKAWTDDARALGALKNGLIQETRKRGGRRLARDLGHILKHI